MYNKVITEEDITLICTFSRNYLVLSPFIFVFMVFFSKVKKNNCLLQNVQIFINSKPTDIINTIKMSRTENQATEVAA